MKDCRLKETGSYYRSLKSFQKLSNFMENREIMLTYKENVADERDGVILRNDSSAFVKCASHVMNGLVQVMKVEAIGLKEALSWVKDIGLSKVLFELDSKQVNGRNVNATEYGSLIACCV
ncbi:hypothetical protein DITRI_Ditri02bG0101000 [Diplodiscus trichospermus]